MPRILTGREISRGLAESLHSFQDKKFRWHVQTMLAECSPYYSELFAERGIKPESITGISSWLEHGLPLIRKDMFRAEADKFRLSAPGAIRSRPTAPSSGMSDRSRNRW